MKALKFNFRRIQVLVEMKSCSTLFCAAYQRQISEFHLFIIVEINDFVCLLICYLHYQVIQLCALRQAIVFAQSLAVLGKHQLYWFQKTWLSDFKFLQENLRWFNMSSRGASDYSSTQNAGLTALANLGQQDCSFSLDLPWGEILSPFSDEALVVIFLKTRIFLGPYHTNLWDTHQQ